MTHHTTRAAAAAILALALGGCNGALHPDQFPTTGPTHTATANPQQVTAADFGNSWALSVDHGTVSCTKNAKGDPVLRFTAPNGTTYALNSLDDNANLPPISDITKGSIGTLRSFAFTVCDK